MRVLRYSGRYFFGTLCGAASGQLFVAAERHATTAQAWLAVWSTLAAVCFWGAI